MRSYLQHILRFSPFLIHYLQILLSKVQTFSDAKLDEELLVQLKQNYPAPPPLFEVPD